jgi:hypothetical protein
MRPNIKAEQTTAKQEDKMIRRKAKGARTMAVGAPLFWFWGAAIVGLGLGGGGAAGPALLCCPLATGGDKRTKAGWSADKQGEMMQKAIPTEAGWGNRAEVTS